MKPLTDLKVLILDYWPTLEDMFLKILAKADGDDDIVKILRDILSKDLLVWVLEDGDGAFGLVTTRLQVINTEPQQTHLIADHGLFPLRLSATVHEQLVGFAKSMNCSKLKTFTKRPGVAKFEESLGWRKSYTELVVDL